MMLNNIAIINKDISYTYLQLLEFIQKTITYLKILNLKEQDRVIILGDNSIELIILIFALNRLGIIFIILDTHLDKNRLKYIITDIQAKIIFIDNGIYSSKKEIIDNYFTNIAFNNNFLKEIDPDIDRDLDKEELFLHYCTSYASTLSNKDIKKKIINGDIEELENVAREFEINERTK